MSKKKYLYICLFFIAIIKLFLININPAEGNSDTYSILNIAVSLLSFDYPVYAKRLPVFPLLISIGMHWGDAIYWARFLVFMFSMGTLLLLSLLAHKFFNDIRVSLLAVLILLFNPVFLYYSFQILDVVPLTFFVLLTFFILFHEELKKKEIVLGIVAGLAAMSRPEGFLLIPSLIIYYILKKQYKKFIPLFITYCFMTVPWILRMLWCASEDYQHAVSQSYFSYYSNYLQYNVDIFAQQFLHFIFISGFPLGIIFITSGAINFFKSNRIEAIVILTYLILDILLIFSWNPYPRLYLSQLPVFSLMFALGISQMRKFSLKYFLLSLILIFLYLLGMKKYHLSFINGQAATIILVVMGSIILSLFWVIAERISYRFRLVNIIILVCLFFASTSVFLSKRYRHSTIFNAVRYAESLPGRIAYNTGIVEASFFLKEKGLKYDPADNKDSQKLLFQKESVNYVLWSNEIDRTESQLSSKNSIVKDKKFSSQFRLLKSFTFEEKRDFVENLLLKYGVLKQGSSLIKASSEIYKIIDT